MSYSVLYWSVRFIKLFICFGFLKCVVNRSVFEHVDIFVFWYNLGKKFEVTSP